MNRNLITLAVIVVLMSVSFATLGSTVLTADRSSTITVENDDAGALSLEPNTATGVVNNESGELEIDLPGNTQNSNGVNINSTLELGQADDFSSPSSINAPAYTMTNNFSNSADVTVGYTLANPSSVEGNLTVVVSDGATSPTVKSFVVQNSSQGSTSGSVTFSGVSSGSTLDVAIQVQTGTSDAANFSGTLQHQATVN